MKKVLVILGVTASGKTDLALNLAKKFNGELISCDSRQVYKGLDIGSGKLPGKETKVKKKKYYWEMDGVKTWMYDIVSPKSEYSAGDYGTDALVVMEGILEKNKLPIIVGGSGLYLRSVLEELDFPAPNKDLRESLNKLTLKELQDKIKKLSLKSWEGLNDSDQKNPRRLVRKIEVLQTPRSPLSKKADLDVLKIGLASSRKVINERIDKRLEKRIEMGLIDEGKRLKKEGLAFKRMRELGLEYRALANLLEGKVNRIQFKKNLEIKIHQYAKRQMVWFKKEKKITWFDIEEKNYVSSVERLIKEWYDPRQ